eukprot:tig00001694_g9571.t1
MGSHDPGHDYAHVLRVVANALAIAKAEGLPEDRLEIVEMPALLHDVKDLKFSGREGATADAVAAFLAARGRRCGVDVDVSTSLGCCQMQGCAATHAERCAAGWSACGCCRARVLVDDLPAHEAACRRPCPNAQLGCTAHLSVSDRDAHLAAAASCGYSKRCPAANARRPAPALPRRARARALAHVRVDIYYENTVQA